MPAIKNNLVQVMFRTSLDIRQRLEHHAKRLGADMNALVREGTVKHLDELDEKEVAQAEMKRLRESKGAFVPYTKPRHWGKPQGLGLKPPRPPVRPSEPPEKIKRSFRRYSEYIESAADKIDAEMRSQTVIEDIKERTASPEEVTLSYEALKEFMKGRAEARYQPSTAVAVDEKVDVAGDIT